MLVSRSWLCWLVFSCVCVCVEVGFKFRLLTSGVGVIMLHSATPMAA